MLSEAKLVMTDALLNRARDDQQTHPIDDADDIETVEATSDDPEADEAGDAADHEASAEHSEEEID
jgi:ribosome maturation factor RimP